MTKQPKRQLLRKERKPFTELVESAMINRNEPLLVIRLTENPAPEERSLFFTIVEQLAEKWRLIKPVIAFTATEIQLLFDRNMPVLLLQSFIEELQQLLFPDKKNGIRLDNRVKPFETFSPQTI